MNVLFTALSVELGKIFGRFKYRALPVIYAIIAVGIGALGSLSFDPFNGGGVTLSAVRLGTAGTGTMLGALSVYRALLLPLAIFMLAADLFAHEFESKSIKCVLTRPVSRMDAFAAKTLAMLCYAAIILSAALCATFAAQTVTSLLTADSIGISVVSVILLSASSFVEALVAYALTLLPMAAVIAFASLVSVLIRSPALVMFLCIVLYGGLAALGTFIDGFGAAIFTQYTGWYRMWLGELMPFKSLLTTTGLLLSTIAILFGVGFLIFDKKDV